MAKELRKTGERLAALHRWYAWTLLFLFLSGAILYIPSLRGPFAAFRVPLRNLHIAFGILSAALTGAYLFMLVRHLASLGKWLGKKINVMISIALAVGWIVSGVILWWDRLFLPWTQAALWWHDVLTWVGIPYLAVHALVRWRKIELALPWARVNHTERGGAGGLPAGPRLEKAIARRRFLVDTVARGVVILLGITGLRWMIKLGRTDGAQAVAPAFLPNYALPTPDPRSEPPIGGGAQGRFRLYNVAPRWPEFDAQTWRLTVDGLVTRPVSLKWDEVLELPRDVWVRDFHCVSGWSVYRVTWEGIPVAHLLDMAGILPEATHVKFYSFDGVYTDALTIDQARLDDTFLAVLKDGKPLTPYEGGPIRLVMPRMFAYKSVKWMLRMELIDEPHRGFWQRLGYAEDAWIPGAPRT